MAKTMREKATEIANSGYTVNLVKDKTTEGDLIYLAINPELDGCMAQGETPDEALSNLNDVRVDYIEHLLEFGLPIPEPTKTKEIASISVTSKVITGMAFPGFETFLEVDEKLIYSTSPST